MQILNYKTFNSNEDFIEWQKTTIIVGVKSVSPFISDAIGNQEENDIIMKTEVAVFVVYVTEDDENEKAT